MKPVCIIGEQRSGVMALSTALEDIGDIVTVGELFNSAAQSQMSKYILNKKIAAHDLSDPDRSFNLFRSFFEYVVADAVETKYSKNGFVFCIKYEDYLKYPSLAYYLETAEVKFIHVYRERPEDALVSTLIYRGTKSSKDLQKLDIQSLRFQSDSIRARWAYFQILAERKNWANIVNEATFVDGFIEAAAARRQLAEIFGVDRVPVLSPKTRAALVSDGTRKEVAAGLEHVLTAKNISAHNKV